LSLAFLPDGYFASVPFQTIIIWDTVRGIELKTLTGLFFSCSTQWKFGMWSL